MRDIAEMHERIVRAFASARTTFAGEQAKEQVVHADTAPNKVPRSAFAALYRRLAAWQGRRRGVPLLRSLKEPNAAGDAKSRQIARVVHEIRTPLNGILGMTHLLGQTKLSAEQQNYLSGIRQSGYALAQLVEDLLDQSTLEAGRFRLNNRAENLRHLIESVVELLAPRAHEKRIEVAATVEAEVPDLLDFDPARIRQVLFNVIGNAVKFTSQGGVLVSAFLQEGNVAIRVSDTGPGMTPDEQRRIFGEFEQAGTAESRSGGTGLGLGIASRILAEFGGSLSVSSIKGQGSTFTIVFPLHSAEQADEGGWPRSALLKKSRVLLLAPEGPAAKATVATIETLGGRCRHVRSTADAQVLIDRAAAGPVPYTDLIVDHRLACDYANEKAHAPLHRILLVNPEERASQPQDFFDAWLIRPLREKSLIDVLSGRLRGFGTRDRLQEMTEKAQAGDPPLALDIVLGEDDPVNALMIRSLLVKAGHKVTVFEDFAGMREELLDGTRRPDLVISDMHMPGGNLQRFLKALREEGAWGGRLPVVVLTGESSEAVCSHALLQGANRVLLKPVEPATLLEEVHSLAARARETQRMR